MLKTVFKSYLKKFAAIFFFILAKSTLFMLHYQVPQDLVPRTISFNSVNKTVTLSSGTSVRGLHFCGKRISGTHYLTL